MSINQISELMLKNTEEEITLIIEIEKQFSLDSFIRGYKVEDDSLYLECEDENEHESMLLLH